LEVNFPMTNGNSMEPMLDLLQDLLIVQLALAGVDNHSIRKVAGVEMRRVTRISKILKRSRRRSGANDG
jgi:hypothetical protein